MAGTADIQSAAGFRDWIQSDVFLEIWSKQLQVCCCRGLTSVLSAMDNTRCFANPFCDYRGALLPAQSAQTVVPIVLATVDRGPEEGSRRHQRL